MKYWTDIFFVLHIFKGGVLYIWMVGLENMDWS